VPQIELAATTAALLTMCRGRPVHFVEVSRWTCDNEADYFTSGLLHAGSIRHWSALGTASVGLIQHLGPVARAKAPEWKTLAGINPLIDTTVELVIRRQTTDTTSIEFLTAQAVIEDLEI